MISCNLQWLPLFSQISICWRPHPRYLILVIPKICNNNLVSFMVCHLCGKESNPGTHYGLTFNRLSPTSLRTCISVTASYSLTSSTIIPGLLKSLNSYHYPSFGLLRYKKATTKSRRFTPKACNRLAPITDMAQTCTCTRLENQAFVIEPRISPVLSIHAMHIPD